MIYDVRGVSLAYGQGPTIVDKASFTLAQGETMTILGPNGAGKSTLLNSLMNLHSPFAGELRLCGSCIQGQSAREIAATVAYVRQHQSPAFSFEVLDYVVMGRAPRLGAFSHPKQGDYDAAMAALEVMGVADLAHRSYADLSGGQRQQVAIARAIAQEPKAILLDEPTAHLDFGNQIRTLELARKLSDSGYAVVMTTHDPNHAMLMEGKTAILDRGGRFTVGHHAGMLTEDRLEELYRARLRVIDVREIDRKACLNLKLRN